MIKILVILVLAFSINCNALEKEMKHTSNPNLETINKDANWQGTPIDEDGRFVNYEYPFENSFTEFLKWQIESNPQKNTKKIDTWKPAISKDSSWLFSKEDCIVWLGHSTFFIRLGGKQIITDPVFSSIGFFINRNIELPIKAELLKSIDYVLISHDHRDHFDVPSLEELSKNNENATYLVGLNMYELTNEATNSKNIQEAGWYQSYKLDSDLKIHFLPARHWSRRGMFDLNKRLWGAFVIEYKGKKIYFSGDTGYGNHFKKAKEIFGGFDYAIIGIGAYKPEWFMGKNHISPKDALKAFQELDAKYFIPMHFGVFDLSDEPISDPLYHLQKYSKEDGIFEQILYKGVGFPFTIK